MCFKNDIILSRGTSLNTYLKVALSKLFYVSFLKKGSILKGKESVPLGSKFFPLRADPFSVQKRKQGVTKCCLVVVFYQGYNKLTS